MENFALFLFSKILGRIKPKILHFRFSFKIKDFQWKPSSSVVIIS